MGWRDDPIAAAPAATPAWKNDPPAASASAEGPGVLETAIEHGANGLAMGAAPKLVGLYAAGGGERDPDHALNPVDTVNKVIDGLLARIRGPSLSDVVTGDSAEARYQKAKADEQAYLKRTQEAHPAVALGANVAGGAIPSALLASVAPVLKGKDLLSRVGSSASQGAVIGGAYGAGSGESLGDVATGAGFGAAGGAAMPVIGAGAKRYLSDPLRDFILRKIGLQATPAAQALEAQGVTGLTVGQKAPQSMLGVIESASASSPFGMAPQREAAREQFMRVAQNKGVAPGAQAPASSDLQGRLKELFAGYEPAYGAIKSTPIPPEAVATLPEAAAVPGRGVDARTAAGVKAEVENALTVLGIKPPASAHSHGHGAPASAPKGLVDQFGREIPPAPAPPPKATAGDLLKVRENIREQIRSARQAQDFDKLRLLEHAEDTVTGALEQALTPEQSAALQATDRQYARLMTAANAAPAGQTNFTPLQYLKQVEKGAGRRAFKTGGAGDLQDLGEAAREVFTELPMTGVRPGILSFLPGAKMWGAPISRAANSEAVSKFLFSRPGSASGTAGNLIDPELAAFIASLQAPRARLVPAGADEEAPR